MLQGREFEQTSRPKALRGRRKPKGSPAVLAWWPRGQETLTDRNGDVGTQGGKAQNRKMRKVIKSKANHFRGKGYTLAHSQTKCRQYNPCLARKYV